MIYLDNSATTPIHPEVSKAMWTYLTEEFGNPSSKYYTLAEAAKKAVEEARTNVASLLNCKPSEVIFTGGSTESNNFILKGVAHYYQNTGKHIITTKVEHKSILETCEFLESEGYKVTYLNVDKLGNIDEEELFNAITSETILVSIMWGNNEIGTLYPIERLSELVKERNPKTFFHTDATQVIGKVNIDLANSNIDFLSLSAHKIYGPKGVGIAFLKNDELDLPRKITPLLHGGSQENGYRSGTLSVHNIVGLGKAAEIASNNMESDVSKILSLEEELIKNLKLINGLHVNGNPKSKIPGIVNVTMPGINNELLIRSLKDQFAISTGSACSLNEPSYVLQSIGLNPLAIKSSIRISLKPSNTVEEITDFCNALKEQINVLSI